jgi:thiol-disulfide isomerase/thioredoxin
MKKSFTTVLTALAGFALATSPAAAAELGMDAPPLKLAKFVKGDPVVLADGKGSQVYVVEFWATWCGPCRTSIPHLTEVQKKFKDKNVTIIGVSDETAAKVEPFVEEMGAKMDYVVAIDKNRSTFSDYMEAFDQGGIPTAFIVNKAGKIVWYGHPMADLESVLEEVVADKFDVAAYKLKQERAEKLQKDMVAYLDQTLGSKYGDETKSQGVAFVKDCEQPEMLNQFAWIILTNPRVKHRDQEVAMAAAKKAYDLSKGMDASITDTYARAFYDSGDKEKAIQYQKEAVERAAGNPEMKAQFEATLKKYLGGK